MKKLTSLLSALALAGGLLAANVAPVAASGGTFYLFDGSNQTGDYRGFGPIADHFYSFGALNYQLNCGGACGPMNNTVSSVQFQCSNWDDTDRLVFHGETSGAGGTYTIDPAYPEACVNGSIKMNLSALFNNWAGSVTFYETGGS